MDLLKRLNSDLPRVRSSIFVLKLRNLFACRVSFLLHLPRKFQTLMLSVWLGDVLRYCKEAFCLFFE